MAFQIRLPESLVALLDAAAREEGRSRNEIILRALRAAFELEVPE